jgi:stearoyl-CoA desaturase (delta-9 desaturase)
MNTSATSVASTVNTGKCPKPQLDGRRSGTSHFLIYFFSIVPLVAVALSIPFAWGWGLSWTDIGLAAGFYIVSGLGVTVGFHRLFTHGSYRANRGLKIGLAIAGQLALQGPVIDWAADHRRHHAFSDREGDPHSPWLFGTSAFALARGFWHAHMGWIFNRDLTNQQRFTPDLLADRDIARVNRAFALCTVFSLLTPALLGGLITWSWAGALSAFFWAGLVRVALLHHVTWCSKAIRTRPAQKNADSAPAQDQVTNPAMTAGRPTERITIGTKSLSMRRMSRSATRSGAKRSRLDSSRWKSQPTCA